MQLLSQFQYSPATKTIFISKVGDNSIDLPNANVIIQISSHFGSRRQEAQRLGRILRPKLRLEGHNAFFYSLVSKDTQEMFFSSKRQQFLVEQGYSFKIVTELADIDAEDLCFKKPNEELELLSSVLAETEEEASLDDVFEGLYGKGSTDEPVQRPARRTQGTLSSLSGGEGLQYLEYSKEGGAEMVLSRIYARNSVPNPLARGPS